jgi:hypothetical protein
LFIQPLASIANQKLFLCTQTSSRRSESSEIEIDRRTPDFDPFSISLSNGAFSRPRIQAAANQGIMSQCGASVIPLSILYRPFPSDSQRVPIIDHIRAIS